MRPKRITVAAALAALVAAAQTVFAQTYPSGPVKLVVPFPAGSATDNLARLVAKELQDDLGQPFVIENRPGAQGIVGADIVARSAPNGSTLLVAAVSLAASQAMVRKVPFDPIADFTPVTRIANAALALMVRTETPARTPREFIDYARSQRGKLSAGYGSSSSQVSIAQLAALANIEVLPVPYKGIPLAINDLLGGSLQLTFADLGNAIAQAKGGKLRAIGVTSAKRSPLVPDWPALAETLPGFDVDAWIATFGPKGLPEPIARRLHEATVRALAKPDIQAKLGGQGLAPALLGPADMVPFMKAEVEKWIRLSKQAGIEPE